jgi:hypothetical protein
MIQKLYTENQEEQLLVTQQLRRLLSKGEAKKHEFVFFEQNSVYYDFDYTSIIFYFTD